MTMREKCLRAPRSSRCRRLATIGALLMAALTVGRSDAAAQPLTLDYQQVVTRAIPGATAAFSLDPSRVGASARDGVVTLVGRGPGSTNVIVVVGDRTESIPVQVGEPPIVRLPGMRGVNSQNAGTGYYEARYGSDPGIVQGSLFLARRQGDRSAELSLGGAAPLADAVSSPFSIPLASFTLRTPRREITLFDRAISNSPLTISRSNVRGLHLGQGPWQVHAGYSFFSTFEHLLLPTSKEAVAGVTYRHRLGPRSTLTPNLYYFDGTPAGGQRGPLGTLLYEARTESDVKFAAEIGVSRALAGAVEIAVDRTNRRAWAKLRVAPGEMPSLTTDQQSGRQLEGGWMWQGDRSSVNATISSRRYMSGEHGHNSSVASIDMRRHLTRAWAIHGGSGVSIFENAAPAASRIHSITLPLGTSFSRGNVGLDMGYQFSRETTRDLGGHLVRASLNGAAGGFRGSVFGERQTHAPTARQILTDVPWLQPMLDRLGLAADTPQQLADLLRTNAELSAYGYANSIQLDVTPARTRLGASGGWSGSGASRPQLFGSTLVNRDDSIERSLLSAVHSLSYSQRLNPATEFFLTWSALCHDRVFSSSCRPVMFASLRRTLSGGAGLLMPRRGHIEGIVFQDDDAQGIYAPDMPPLAGVEVILDSVRHTRTDGTGRFRFDDVPHGRHLVEARYASGRATFFTTPSPADVETGGFVHFGVALSRSSLRGVVRTDAGLGVPGVMVHIAGAERRTTIRTADDGTFAAQGLLAGDYDVSLDAGSVPAGYPVETLAPQRVRVGETTPGRATFLLQPYRSVSGRARVFDRETGQYVSLGGATVELQPLRRQSVTDANGQYAFRDLPPGEYTIVANHNGRDHVVTVSVPEGPALVKGVDVAVVPASDVVPAGSLRARASDRPAASAQARKARDESGEDGAATAAGSFTIQVAESASARHARAMVTELKEAGHAAYLVEAERLGSGAPYHVRVGNYPTLAEAARSARTLEKALGWRLSVTAVPPHLAGAARGISYSQ
jgi:cell division septation protein DedD